MADAPDANADTSLEAGRGGAVPEAAGPTVTRACSHCGITAEAPEGGLPLGWSFAVEERGTLYQCQACIRGNIRAIEGKLPQEYWEF